MIETEYVRVHVKIDDGQEFILTVIGDMITPSFFSRCVWMRDLTNKHTIKNTASRVQVPFGVVELNAYETQSFIQRIDQSSSNPILLLSTPSLLSARAGPMEFCSDLK